MELTEIRDRIEQAMDLIEPIPEAMVPLVYRDIMAAHDHLDAAYVSVAGDVKQAEDMQRDPDEAGPGMRAKVVS